MRRFTLVTGLFTAMASMCLHAQTMDMRGSIPFDFRIGSAAFPSGEYLIHNDTRGVLSVRQVDGQHQGGVFMTVGDDHPNTQTLKGTLLFNRYGDTYFLAKVWTPDSETARATIKTAREKELASHLGLPQNTTVALRTK